MQGFGLTMIGTMESLDDVLNILSEIDLSTLMRIRATSIELVQISQLHYSILVVLDANPPSIDWDVETPKVQTTI